MVLESGVFNGGVAINDGRIYSIGSDHGLPQASQTIDAEGNFVMPGLIDPHTHPGKRDFLTDVQNESLVASVGGVTTMGAIVKSSRMGEGWNDRPPEPASYNDVFPPILERLPQILGIDLYFTYAIVTDEQAREIPSYVRNMGVTSFKFYLGYMGGDSVTRRAGLGNFSSRLGFSEGFDDGTVYLGFREIGRLGPPCIAHIHAENMYLTRVFFEEIDKSGRPDMTFWHRRSPPITEAFHIHTYSYLARATNCALYVVHISSAEGYQELIRAREAGTKIVGETGPQWLSIDCGDDPPGSLGKVNPPVRDSRAHDALWKGVASGQIECIGTDHVPNMPDQCHGDLLVTPEVTTFKGTGAVGMQTMFPAIFTYGVLQGRLSLETLVKACTANNARAAGLYPKKGSLSPGADADVVIFDPKLKKRVTSEVIQSPANAFFRDRELYGWPTTTILRGKVVFSEGHIVGKPGTGVYLKRSLASEHTNTPMGSIQAPAT